MKKITLALAVSSVLGVSSAAHALNASEFASGVLVPHALWAEDGSTSTAISLTDACGGTVYWTFFDVDTKHVIDGEFDTSRNDWVAFSHGSTIGDVAGEFNSGPQFPGDPQLGYYVFVHSSIVNNDLIIGESAAPCLAGNAFQVFPGQDDVAYIPAIPLHPRDLKFGANVIDLGPDSVVRLHAGAQANDGDILYLNYVDDIEVSNIVIWSAQDVSGSYTVNIYDTDQNRASTTLNLPNKELNVVDSKTINKPIDFAAGFIRWDLRTVASKSGEEDGIASFTVYYSEAFGAAQTVLNPILHGEIPE